MENYNVDRKTVTLLQDFLMARYLTKCMPRSLQFSECDVM